ncbi:MAG: TrbI/VirB10 family protein [Alphaproteobacteria bacterium]|nr:TrbI/VirB10 family protein [Alphaproteobacteria bacterium]
MSPDASPGELSGKTGVRRVNNMPLYLVGAALLVFFVIMAIVASDRAAQQNKSAQSPKDKGGNTTNLANDVIGGYKDGIIPAKGLSLPPLPGAQGTAIPIVHADKLDIPPLPSSTDAAHLPAQGAPNADEGRIRTMKMQRLEEAIRARTTIAIASPRSAGSSPVSSSTHDETLARLAAMRQQIDAATTSNDPSEAYKARLSRLQGSGEGSGSQTPFQVSSNSSKNSMAQFDRTKGDRWRLDSATEAPRTPYELRAGYVIPATLISGINSDLPGQIIAQVSQNVFDTPTGKFMLIPQGSRLVGTYSSDVVYGQSRVLVAWQRIVFPDGKALDIGAMPGADGAGYAGFEDQVNNHFARLFGSAILMSIVPATVSYTQQQNQPTTTYGTQSFSGAMAESLGQQMGQATAQVISKNLKIAPTIEIRPGYRFHVMATTDLTFPKPYEPFDY